MTMIGPHPLARPLLHTIDDETRATALKRTADTMRELNKIRLSLELPPAAIQQVLEVYAASAREAMIAKERAEQAKHVQRLPMKMTSLDDLGVRRLIPPGRTVEVDGFPQWIAYRVEEIEIDGDPSRWLVHDIRVGNRTQRVQSADASRPFPGERFRKGGIMSELRLETCQTAMSFTLVVEYVGPISEGEVFEATIVGTAVE